jgi:ATPase subunit of ABC transporter with duplicated ATPase domains
MGVLKQNHFEFDAVTVLNTVMMGNKKLWDVMIARTPSMPSPISAKPTVKGRELEILFAEMEGWNAESEAANLLSGLGIHEDYHHKLMAN